MTRVGDNAGNGSRRFPFLRRFTMGRSSGAPPQWKRDVRLGICTVLHGSVKHGVFPENILKGIKAGKKDLFI